MFSQTSKKKREFKKEQEFDVYKFCKEKWGLTKDQIKEVKSKRTYKSFVEYQVKWKSQAGNGTHIFKMIIKKKENEDD